MGNPPCCDRDPRTPVDTLDEYARDLSRLNALLQAWQHTHGWNFLGGINHTIDPEVWKDLETLGYVF